MKNADELYYNLIGDDWDASISNATFRITMPKLFDKSLLGFSSGTKGTINSSIVNYSVNENVITGSLNNALNPREALTVRLRLPENYFIGTSSKTDYFYSVFVVSISLSCVLIVYSLWSKYGKDNKIIETVEMYPPDGLNSAEIQYLYNGDTKDRGAISLLIYLANKGYLKIEETTTNKNVFSKEENFIIQKIKEYDGNNKAEKNFFMVYLNMEEANK